MGIVFGWLTLICLVGLLVKAVARKMALKKANKLLAKVHKPLSVLFLLLSLIHFWLVLPVFLTRTFSLYTTGCFLFVVGILLIILCHVLPNAGGKRIRWHRVLSVLMLLLCIAHMVLYYVDFAHYSQRIQEIEIQEIDPSRLADGEYTGEYDAGYIYAKVKVSVEQGEISQIQLLEHRNERGSAAENIIHSIIDSQSVQVDAVSGATNSGKVIRKAVENALVGRHPF